MTTRWVALIVVAGLCLLLAACSGGPSGGPGTDSTGPGTGAEDPEPALPPTPPSKPGVGEDVDLGAYRTLKCGGSMYAGTVVSVTVEGSEKGTDPCEWGHIRFRVARTIAGPQHEEMTLPFFCWLDDPLAVGGTPPVLLQADWAGAASPWPARPKRGERLLLLLADEKEAAKVQSKLVGPLFHRWEVNPDDPLVDGFAVAARFLAAEDEATRDDLFEQLCQSPFENMKKFAWEAAFYPGPWSTYVGLQPDAFRDANYDPARQSHVAVLYLKHATPGSYGVTVGFADWFKHHLRGITEELKAAFEDWYVKELSVRDDMRRPKTALKGLMKIVEGNGVPMTVGLFKKSGQDGLLECVTDCARSGDPEVEKLSKELLAKLDEQ